MAENKKSFLLYCDIIHTVEKLSDEKAGQLLKHILKYVNDLNPETDDLIIQLAFEPIKQQLKRDLKKYEVVCDRNKINGLKGGRPKNPKEPKKPSGLFENPEKPKKPDSDTDSDTDIDNDKEKDNKKTNKKEFDFYSDFSLCELLPTQEENFKYLCQQAIELKNVQSLSQPLTAHQLYKLIKEYGKDAVMTKLEAMDNTAGLHKKYVSAYKTANNWLKMGRGK